MAEHIGYDIISFHCTNWLSSGWKSSGITLKYRLHCYKKYFINIFAIFVYFLFYPKQVLFYSFKTDQKEQKYLTKNLKQIRKHIEVVYKNFEFNLNKL